MENLNDGLDDNLDDFPEALIEPKPEMINSKKGWNVFTITLICILVFLIFSILKAGEYGYTLFLSIPFTLAFILSFREAPKSKGKALLAWGKAIGIITILSLLLLAMGAEGVICILMAIGVIILPTFAGCLLGYTISKAYQKNRFSILMTVFFITPGTLMYDMHDKTKINSIAEKSIHIHAPADRVWQVLTRPVTFDKSHNFFLKAGVSYPLDMKIIQKEAKNYLSCSTNNGKTEFNIDSLIAPRKLQFSTIHEILPMRELTLYHDLEAAHLHGYFESDYGVFEIQVLTDDECLLIAKTRYAYAITPAFYWKWWSDYLLNAMHRNVLTKVKTLAEKQAIH